LHLALLNPGTRTWCLRLDRSVFKQSVQLTVSRHSLAGNCLLRARLTGPLRLSPVETCLLLEPGVVVGWLLNSVLVEEHVRQVILSERTRVPLHTRLLVEVGVLRHVDWVVDLIVLFFSLVEVLVGVLGLWGG